MTADRNTTTIIVRDFKCPARIGIYPFEHNAPQMIVVDIDMELHDYRIVHDNIDATVSYEDVIAELRRLSGLHHELVETLAEDVSRFVLRDDRVSTVTVTIRKTEVYNEGTVGVTITRKRQPSAN